jgi:hypothetical protein
MIPPGWGVLQIPHDGHRRKRLAILLYSLKKEKCACLVPSGGRRWCSPDSQWRSPVNIRLHPIRPSFNFIITELLWW